LPKLSKSFQWTPSQIAALAKGQKAIYILAVDELISGSESDDNCAIEDLVETSYSEPIPTSNSSVQDISQCRSAG
jgi:hypothetical protein